MSRETERIAGYSIWIGLIILIGLCVRLWRVDQPLVENYVGRQIPTAMVARNLELGKGFGQPQLSTGPFPNWFVVEPPIFEAAAVFVSRMTGEGLDPSGRMVSALALAMAGVGLSLLARPRIGDQGAIAACLALTFFPLSVRYGRAFQPDALAIGCAVMGLALWDLSMQRRLAPSLRLLAWCLIATGIAQKAPAAAILAPALVASTRPKRDLPLLALALIPMVLWYRHAYVLIHQAGGSPASIENLSIWSSAIGPAGTFAPETLKSIAKSLAWRSFTPLGIPLALAGFIGLFRGARTPQSRFWPAWAGASVAVLLAAGQKLHHEYYWLILAPPLAAGIGLAFAGWSGNARRNAFAVAGAGLLAVTGVVQARSTFQTPREWSELAHAVQALRDETDPGEHVAAPEALLYASDRRGARLELEPASAARAAGEWGAAIDPTDPLALMEVYRSHGIRVAADLGPATGPRAGWRQAMRGAYRVVVDQPCVFIARLDTMKTASAGREIASDRD